MADKKTKGISSNPLVRRDPLGFEQPQEQGSHMAASRKDTKAVKPQPNPPVANPPAPDITPSTKGKRGQGKVRSTYSFSLPDELAERVRRAAYHEDATVSDVVEYALRRALSDLEQQRGKPYEAIPKRKSLIKGDE